MSTTTWPALCARLDDLPLAIELAAAQVRLLGPAEILRHLRDHLALPLDGARNPLPIAHAERRDGLELPSARRHRAAPLSALGVFVGDARSTRRWPCSRTTAR